jgi:hypothetical protein
MSGFLFSDKTDPDCGDNANSRPRTTSLSKLPIIAVIASAVLAQPLAAGPLDWFMSGNKSRKAAETKVIINNNPTGSAESALQLSGSGSDALSGQNLDPLSFARTHWNHAKDKLEKICRAIMGKSNDRANADLLTKLFVIDTQVFKEAIKNSGMAINELSSANEGMRQQLADLTRIITAPGHETLESLEKSVQRLKNLNQSQILLVKKYLVGSERIIEIGNKSYETLELIPSLNVTGTDLTVASSKQMMKLAQSNSEAFKGLILNVQSSYEQFHSGLDMITRTVKETLRFSDHFAIRQFPLINLPAPSREKIYVQLNSLNNSLKGVANTLSIGDSQVRNTSQQMTHLVSALGAKVAEALKFSAPSAASSDRAIIQISSYAQNQVAGLFQRVKEDIHRMRSDMAAVVRSGDAGSRPGINLETRSEYVARRTTAVTQNKLPLFLLGTGAKAAAANDQSEQVASVQVKHEEKPQVLSKVLYSESRPERTDGLMSSEIDILKDELGENFFFAEDQAEVIPDEDAFASEETFDSESEDENYSQDEENMQISYENLENIAEPEIELLRFDMSENTQDSAELLPMMRMEDESLMFEE